jgi:hypothetical protein
MNRVDIGDTQYLLDWTFQDSNLDISDGTKVTLRFTSTSPYLELKSIWWARSGPGPIEHYMTIKNNSGSNIMLYQQESLDINVMAGVKDQTKVWYVNKDGGAPFLCSYQWSGFGVYIDDLTNGYNKDIWTKLESYDLGFIPWNQSITRLLFTKKNYYFALLNYKNSVV